MRTHCAAQSDPTRFVSGSDDGTVRLWSIREEAPTAVIDAKANVCSVQFSPSCANLLAFGSANYRVYLYDLRQMRVRRRSRVRKSGSAIRSVLVILTWLHAKARGSKHVERHAGHAVLKGVPRSRLSLMDPV